jgi:hypothetical protein
MSSSALQNTDPLHCQSVSAIIHLLYNNDTIKLPVKTKVPELLFIYIYILNPSLRLWLGWPIQNFECSVLLLETTAW